MKRAGPVSAKGLEKDGKEWKGKGSKRGKERVRAGAGAGQRLYRTTVSVWAQEMHTTEGSAGENYEI